MSDDNGILDNNSAVGVEEYIRKCPDCGREIQYGYKWGYNAAERNKSLCMDCITRIKKENGGNYINLNKNDRDREHEVRMIL